MVLRDLQRSGHGPATSMVRREERDRLSDAIEALQDPDREVMLLRFFEGLPVEAIADRTGQSPSSVRRAIGRATVQLGKRLGAAVPLPSLSHGSTIYCQALYCQALGLTASGTSSSSNRVAAIWP